MKKLVLICIMLSLAASFIFVQGANAKITLLKGTIIDNMCADAHKEDIATFIKTHPKTCALTPACAASGYSIFADGKLTKFDKDSNATIKDFLKKQGTKLDVYVEVEKVGNELKLVSIKNAS